MKTLFNFIYGIIDWVTTNIRNILYFIFTIVCIVIFFTLLFLTVVTF